MPITNPSEPPTFPDVYRLVALLPREARMKLREIHDRVVHYEGEHRYALVNASLDPERVLSSRSQLYVAQCEEREAKCVLVLLEDMAFRKELMQLDTLWRQFRLSHTGATDHRFADAMMAAPEQDTIELHTSWQRICDIIKAKATATPVSALAI